MALNCHKSAPSILNCCLPEPSRKEWVLGNSHSYKSVISATTLVNSLKLEKYSQYLIHAHWQQKCFISCILSGPTMQLAPGISALAFLEDHWNYRTQKDPTSLGMYNMCNTVSCHQLIRISKTMGSFRGPGSHDAHHLFTSPPMKRSHYGNYEGLAGSSIGLWQAWGPCVWGPCLFHSVSV